MKTLVTHKPKPQNNSSFEDLYEDDFSSMQWNPGVLKRAMPKENTKIRKMKTR